MQVATFLIVMAVWLGIVYSYFEMRRLRDSFVIGEPGRTTMNIVTRLFGVIALVQTLSPIRVVLGGFGDAQVLISIIAGLVFVIALWISIYQFKKLK